MPKKKNKNIMICVTQQKSCERLIERGALIREGSDVLHVVHVVKESWKYFSEMEESDALDYLYEVSKARQAQLSVIHSDDIEASLSDFAKAHQVTVVIMGESKEDSRQQDMILRLKKKISIDVTFDIVPEMENDD
jgi:K+-sensing histidine kinase KdpD